MAVASVALFFLFSCFCLVEEPKVHDHAVCGVSETNIEFNALEEKRFCCRC